MVAIRARRWQPVLAYFAVACIGLLPLARFVVVWSHSIIHYWMTFRSLAAAVAVMSCPALAAAGPLRPLLRGPSGERAHRQ